MDLGVVLWVCIAYGAIHGQVRTTRRGVADRGCITESKGASQEVVRFPRAEVVQSERGDFTRLPQLRPRWVPLGDSKKHRFVVEGVLTEFVTNRGSPINEIEHVKSAGFSVEKSDSENVG